MLSDCRIYLALCSISLFPPNGLSFFVLWKIRLVDVVPSLEEICYASWLLSFGNDWAVASRKVLRSVSLDRTSVSHVRSRLRSPVNVETYPRVTTTRFNMYHRPGCLPLLLLLLRSYGKWDNSSSSESLSSSTTFCACFCNRGCYCRASYEKLRTLCPLLRHRFPILMCDYLHLCTLHVSLPLSFSYMFISTTHRNIVF